MHTSILPVVYHDAIAVLKSFSDSEFGGHVEKVSHELLLIIAHLSVKTIIRKLHSAAASSCCIPSGQRESV